MKSALVQLLLAGILLLVPPSAGLAASSLDASANAPEFLPRTGQIGTYDRNGKPIDYKGSGQDGEFQRGRVWPEPRFIVNGDGTISDLLTGLMWLKAGNCFGDLPWPVATQTVNDFNTGALTCAEVTAKYNDWFLPDLDQLASLFDFQSAGAGDALRAAGFSDVQNGIYWSATPYRNLQDAWGVDFVNGTISAMSRLERHFIMIARLPAGKADGQSPEASSSRPTAEAVRFVDNKDGTITDNRTGLMWLQDASCLPSQEWQQALSGVNRLGSGGVGQVCPGLKGSYNDWSLPNVVELRSLIDYGRDYPALPPGTPFLQVLSAGYWTSTTVVAAPAQAYILDLDSGEVAAVNKSEKRRVLAVRQRGGVPARARKEGAREGENIAVNPQLVLKADPKVASEINWPPSKRFFNNDDGTSLDILTGINWLTDGNCFGRKSWPEAVEAIKRFNAQSSASTAQDKRPMAARRNDFKCSGYDGGIDDWTLPTYQELLDLGHPGDKDGAAELNRQGLRNVQSNGSYWSGTETPLNLYFADAVDLKTGKAGNYPKSLAFFVLPHRALPVEENGAASEPLLNLTANTIGNSISVSPQDPISLVVYLYTFGSRTPADFWFWYDTPDGKRLWLTKIRTWTDKAVPVYQGPVFNLINYEIFRSEANNFPPGIYEFHFAIDTTPNGEMDENRNEISVSVVISGAK